MKNDRPPAYKHKIWWMGNKESSLPGLMMYYYDFFKNEDLPHSENCRYTSITV